MAGPHVLTVCAAEFVLVASKSHDIYEDQEMEFAQGAANSQTDQEVRPGPPSSTRRYRSKPKH